MPNGVYQWYAQPIENSESSPLSGTGNQCAYEMKLAKRSGTVPAEKRTSDSMRVQKLGVMRRRGTPIKTGVDYY